MFNVSTNYFLQPFSHLRLSLFHPPPSTSFICFHSLSPFLKIILLFQLLSFCASSFICSFLSPFISFDTRLYFNVSTPPPSLLANMPSSFFNSFLVVFPLLRELLTILRTSCWIFHLSYFIFQMSSYPFTPVFFFNYWSLNVYTRPVFFFYF